MRRRDRLKRLASRAITWLHLSDVHLCPKKTGWDADPVLSSLREDLQHMQKAHGLHPDLIFFTGDLAFGQLPDSSMPRQYDQAASFLDSIRESFRPAIDKGKVFLVPGNHDVNRSLVGRPDTQWLDDLKGDEGARTISELMRDRNHEWRSFMKRLVEYRKFLRKYKYDHVLTDAERLVYAVKPVIAGFRIGIAGFNTAWSSSREKEKGKLWLGRWQVEALRSQLDGCDFRIALTHHPLNWFREEEDPNLSVAIEESFDFHLHGHEHQGWVHTQDRHVRIGAGACYESSTKENGYSFGTIFPQEGRGEILFRRYDAAGRGWVARTVRKKAENDGRWPLRLLWLNPKLERKIEDLTTKLQVKIPLRTEAIAKTFEIKTLFRSKELTRQPSVLKVRSSGVVKVEVGLDFYSCFISYSSQDQGFAERLHADLEAKGVRCWFAPLDLRAGDKFPNRIEENIRTYERMLLVLSQHSIGSPWVEREVEAAFERERREKRTVLFPIRLDDEVMKTDVPWAAEIRRTRHVGDMTGWEGDDSYVKALDRLLRDLRKDPKPRKDKT